MKNCGFSLEDATRIEKSFKELYSESIDDIESRLKLAEKTGYVELAFGLRLRTPLLAHRRSSNRTLAKQAQKEARTAGNAIGQSFNLLNTRACIEFMRIVRNSKYRHSILPCCHIHDAQYYLVKADNLDALLFLNTHLSKAVSWQELPEIAHDVVKLSGQTEIFYPDWSKGFDIPNDCNEATLKNLITQHLQKLKG